MNRPLFFIAFLTVLMVLAGSAAIFDPAARAGQVVQGESAPVGSQPVSRPAGAAEQLERPDQILQRLLEVPTPVIAPTIPGQRALPRGIEPTPRLSGEIASGEKCSCAQAARYSPGLDFFSFLYRSPFLRRMLLPNKAMIR